MKSIGLQSIKHTRNFDSQRPPLKVYTAARGFFGRVSASDMGRK